MLLVMMTTATAWALDPRPMAVYCDENKTLYLTYGDPYVVTPSKADNSGWTFTPEGTNQVLDVTISWAGDDPVIPSGGKKVPAWSSQVKGSASTVVIESSFAVVRPTSTYSWFGNFTALSSIQGMENLNTSEVTTMRQMFSECHALSMLDLSFFDTSKVTDMGMMFTNCYNLVSIYIGDGWNTSLVTSSEMMFAHCNSIVGDDGTTFQQNNWASSRDKTRAHADAGGYMRLYPPINLSDGSDNTATLSKAIADKKYRAILNGRTIYCDGDWNTLCLPFNVSDLTGTPLEGFTVKELDTGTAYNGHLTGMDGSTLYLNFRDATSITAGVPYIVKKLSVKDDATTPAYTATEGTPGFTSSYDFNYYNLIANDPTKRWRPSFTSGGSVYCEFHADAPVLVTGYTLTSGNVTSKQDPKVWTLQAKQNEGDAWTVIDSRDANTNSSDAVNSNRTAPKDYTVQHPGTYQYFRFEVTANGGADYVCISELTLKAIYPDDVDIIENPMFKPVTVSTAEPVSVGSSDGAVSFTGTFNPISYETENTDVLLFDDDNALHSAGSGSSLGACRAFFLIDPTQVGGASLTDYCFVFGNGETLTGTFVNILPGDANGDGQITLADAVGVVNHIQGKTQENFNALNADFDGNGRITITDAVSIVIMLPQE